MFVIRGLKFETRRKAVKETMVFFENTFVSENAELGTNGYIYYPVRRAERTSIENDRLDNLTFNIEYLTFDDIARSIRRGDCVQYFDANGIAIYLYLIFHPHTYSIQVWVRDRWLEWGSGYLRKDTAEDIIVSKLGPEFRTRIVTVMT